MNQRSIWQDVFNMCQCTTNLSKETIIETLESKYSVTLKQKASTLQERKKVFANRIAEFKTEYDSKMLREFYSYWSECSDGGVKFRFEKEKVFEMKKRLATWKRNEKPKEGEKPVQTLKKLDYENG